MQLDKRYAVVFPGQGSQYVGMINNLSAMSNLVRDLFVQSSDLLGYDMWDLVCNGPEATLNQTKYAQPALLIAGVATWQVWASKIGNKPEVVAGHSLGEYAALVCAGVVGFADAVKLVAARGEYMQQAVPVGVGAMAAILGLEDAMVDAICKEVALNQVVSIAGFNSPRQVVIAGHQEAVARAVEAAKKSGAKRAILLPVSVPSHCLLMKPATVQFAKHLNWVNFSTANIPVVQNIDAIARTDVDSIRQALLEQLYKPVRWVGVIQTILSSGIKCVIECGPGDVLSGLNKRIERSLDVQCLHDADSFQKAIISIGVT